MDDHDMDPVEPVEEGFGGWPEEDPDLAAAETADLADLDPVPADLPDYLDDAGGPDETPAPLGYADDYAAEPVGVPGAEGAPPPLGVDPDLDPLADADLGQDPPFPPALDLDLPEPLDGPPWTDPAVLGDGVLPDLADQPDAPPVADLYGYAGEQPPAGGDAWAALLASDDPATAALARWWHPG